MGIWGHTDPGVPARVKQAAVQAVLDAEANARDGGAVVGDRHDPRPLSQVQGTDQMAGFAVDDSAADPVGARAGHRRDARHVRRRAGPRRPVQPDRAAGNTSSAPTTRATCATASPTLLGGTAVIAAGTLGRQESDRRRPRLRRGREQGASSPTRSMRALAHAHRITDTTLEADNAVVHDRGRERGPARGDVVQPPRRTARLPGPAQRAGGNNGSGTWDWRAGRRHLHDQPLAERAVLQRHGRPTPRHLGDRRPRRRSGVRHGPGRGVPGGHERDPALVRRVAGHPRRAHHRPRQRPARLLLGPALGRLPAGAARAERLRAVQRRLAPRPGQRRRGSRGRRAPSDSIRPRSTRTPRSTTRTRSHSRRSSSTRTRSRPTTPR